MGLSVLEDGSSVWFIFLVSVIASLCCVFKQSCLHFHLPSPSHLIIAMIRINAVFQDLIFAVLVAFRMLANPEYRHCSKPGLPIRDDDLISIAPKPTALISRSSYTCTAGRLLLLSSIPLLVIPSCRSTEDIHAERWAATAPSVPRVTLLS